MVVKPKPAGSTGGSGKPKELNLALAETLAEARRLELPPADSDKAHGAAAADESALAAAIRDLVDAIGPAEMPSDGAPVDPDALYGRAVDHVREGRPAAALGALLALQAAPGARAQAARALATLALRHARDDAALQLAERGLTMAPGHPRDSLVAGLVELQRSHRRAAQAHLAAAARSARRRPEYREDLRLAQRALLLLHLS